MEETGVPGENNRPVASHWQTLSHNVVSSTPHSLVVIGIAYNQLSFDQDHDGPYSAISWREQVIRWRGEDACFILDQYVVLNFNC